jgi:hypothetical protein
MLWPVLLLLAAASDTPGPAPAARLGEAEAIELARTISATVEELRGLKFKKPVAVKVVDDAVARAHFKTRLAKLGPAEKLRLQQAALVQLGLLPEGTNVVEAMLDVLEEQAGGYYDPERDTFFILADMPRAVGPMLMAHELTHALDDQHYGIDQLHEAAGDDDDRGAALAAVVEGSGTLVMSVYLMREMSAGRLPISVLAELQQSEAGKAEKLKAAPPLLQRALVASYALGQTFLLRGDLMRLKDGPDPKDIDQAFQDLPESSEQILHPEKYWQAPRERPQPVQLPDLSARIGAGWKLAVSGRLGELSLAVMSGAPALDPASFEITQPGKWTTPAAAGWAGDLYQHYTKAGSAVTVLATRWDSEADAIEFERAVAWPEDRRARRGRGLVMVAGDVGSAGPGLTRSALEALAE